MKISNIKMLCRTLVFTALLLSVVSASARAAPPSFLRDVTCDPAVNDHTTTLQDAIDAAPNGAQIRIHGICNVSSTIILKGGLSYIGDVRGNNYYDGNDVRTSTSGTAIQVIPGFSGTAVLASSRWYNNGPYAQYADDPIRIAHLQIDGNAKQGPWITGIVLRSWLATIEDVLIQQMSGHGILLSRVTENGTNLAGSMVNGRISNVFITNVEGHGIHAIDNGANGDKITDTDILDSWIGGTGKSGIFLESSAGWKIRGNHLYDIEENGIYANKCFGTAIDENYVEDFGIAGGNATWYGIACTMQGGSNDVDNSVGSTINGNKVFRFKTGSNNATYRYIGVPQVNYGVGAINVVGNMIAGQNSSNDVGLYYSSWSGWEGTGLNVLSNNHIQNIDVDNQRRQYIPEGTTLNYVVGQ